MVSIEVTKHSSGKEIIISGHALYDTLGKDIVCAAISSIVITTVNGIQSLDSKSLEVIEGDTLKIIQKNNTDTVNKLIDNMINLLSELEKKYKKNIKIIYREVS